MASSSAATTTNGSETREYFPAMADVNDDFEEEVPNIVSDTDAKGTQSVIKASVRLLKEYCDTIGTPLTAVHYNVQEICELLGKFYADVRRSNGLYYSQKSMRTIRYGLQRHFQKVSNFDIINDKEFKSANEIHSAMLVKVKKEVAVRHKYPITPEDMERIMSSSALDVSTPRGLQNKVFIDIMIYLCIRGRQKMREMTRNNFSLKTDSQGHRYVTFEQKFNKKDRDNDEFSDNEEIQEQGGRMYETRGSSRCPVTSFKRYVESLNGSCTAFWQRPKRGFETTCTSDSYTVVGYDNIPIGKNTLAEKLKTISQEAQCSRVYTNLCLRATVVTTLYKEGFNARHIMRVSGHKSENSIRDYSRVEVGEDKKRQMSSVLFTKVQGKNSNDTLNPGCVTAVLNQTKPAEKRQAEVVIQLYNKNINIPPVVKKPKLDHYPKIQPAKTPNNLTVGSPTNVPGNVTKGIISGSKTNVIVNGNMTNVLVTGNLTNVISPGNVTEEGRTVPQPGQSCNAYLLSIGDIAALFQECQRLREENKSLKEEIKKISINGESFNTNNEKLVNSVPQTCMDVEAPGNRSTNNLQNSKQLSTNNTSGTTGIQLNYTAGSHSENQLVEANSNSQCDISNSFINSTCELDSEKIRQKDTCTSSSQCDPGSNSSNSKFDLGNVKIKQEPCDPCDIDITSNNSSNLGSERKNEENTHHWVVSNDTGNNSVIVPYEVRNPVTTHVGSQTDQSSFSLCSSTVQIKPVNSTATQTIKIETVPSTCPMCSYKYG